MPLWDFRRPQRIQSEDRFQIITLSKPTGIPLGPHNTRHLVPHVRPHKAHEPSKPSLSHVAVHLSDDFEGRIEVFLMDGLEFGEGLGEVRVRLPAVCWERVSGRERCFCGFVVRFQLCRTWRSSQTKTHHSNRKHTTAPSRPSAPQSPL
jgi:hypothetical protein